MSRAEELADWAVARCNVLPSGGLVASDVRKMMLICMNEYGYEARKKAAQECRDLIAYDEDDPGESCAKAIEKMTEKYYHERHKV